MFNVAAGMWVVILFLLAGMLVGGVWSAYQNGSKAVTVILALIWIACIIGLNLIHAFATPALT